MVLLPRFRIAIIIRLPNFLHVANQNLGSDTSTGHRLVVLPVTWSKEAPASDYLSESDGMPDSQYLHASVMLLNSDFLGRILGSREDDERAKRGILERDGQVVRRVTEDQAPDRLECLRPGQVFEGYQKSDQHRYTVRVELKDVDLQQSTFSGYLTIENLTSENPSLTTFFESEIIGKKHSFLTRKWVLQRSQAIPHH